MLQESIWFPGTAGLISLFCFIFSLWAFFAEVRKRLTASDCQGWKKFKIFFTKRVWKMKIVFMMGFVLTNLGMFILFLSIWLKNYYFLLNLGYPGYFLTPHLRDIGWSIVFVGLLFKARALTYDRFGEAGWISIILLSAGFVGLLWLMMGLYQ